jgi:hypothetical protein
MWLNRAAPGWAQFVPALHPMWGDAHRRRSREDHNSMTEETPPRRVLLDVQRHLAPLPRIHYVDFPFQVPEGASKVGLTFSFHKERLAQLFISLHDPAGFRGNRMQPAGKGDISLELWVTPDDSSEGGLPGALPPGRWRAQLDIEALGEETDARLQVYAEFGPVSAPLDLHYPEHHVVRAAEGWYKGELHAHSTESDGDYPVADVVQASVDSGLEFLSLSDHFTTSQWRKLAPLVDGKLALLRSCEITSHHGHANLHGIHEWVDVYVDRRGWDMNQAADAVHAQGGLFCVNHAFSGFLGWRAYDFDWCKADLMEIYHNLEGPNNSLHPLLWDRHLSEGRRVVGVAGVDTHHLYKGTHKLGELVTWVYAPELSERGIIQGLRRGRVYMSRGPELRWSATNAAGARAEMWESLPLGTGPITFEVRAMNNCPLWLFALKNGYIFDVRRIEDSHGDWQAFTFADEPLQPSYYRVELHSIHENEAYPFIQWRDFETTQALTNPIWVGRDRLPAPSRA